MPRHTAATPYLSQSVRSARAWDVHCVVNGMTKNELITITRVIRQLHLLTRGPEQCLPSKPVMEFAEKYLSADPVGDLSCQEAWNFFDEIAQAGELPPMGDISARVISRDGIGVQYSEVPPRPAPWSARTWFSRCGHSNGRVNAPSDSPDSYESFAIKA